MLLFVQWIQIKNGIIRSNKVAFRGLSCSLGIYLDFSSDEERNTKMKSKLRQTLKIVNHELAETSCTNAPDDTVDFFEIIYECVSTRNICLNFLNFNKHHLTGNDVNSTLLQALLKSNTSTRSSSLSLSSLVTSKDTSSCSLNLHRKRELLNLAYDWRQIDVVTKSIIIYERDWQV